MASTKENFDKAKDLFTKKWNSKKQNEFINYMKSMWLSTHQKWNEGVAFNTPSNKQIATRELGNIIEYYCPVGEQTKVTEEQIKTVQELRWNTFDQFKKRASSVWKVTLPSDASNEKWKEGKCTCPFFLKKYMCKHIIGLAIRLKSAKPPPAAKDVPIGKKRKRGRPKQAKKALIID